MSTVVEIGMSEFFVGDQTCVITTKGIGSCIVIALYDRLSRVGGLAHALLPSVYEGGGENDMGDAQQHIAKYADQAVDTLVLQIEKKGGVRTHLVAKLIGGAHMFPLLDGDEFGIGFENAASARAQLLKYAIPIETEIVGGSVGRNVSFDCATGIVEIITKV